MSKDDNLISFTGDGRNIWRNLKHLFGPDVPGHDVPRAKRVVYEKDIVLPPGRRIADTLKFSGVHGLTVIVEGLVPGGYEDCVDVNNGCRDIVVSAPDGYAANGEYVSTVKGGSQQVVIAGPILVHGRVVDHGLGNWSDQSDHRTRDVVLDTPARGGPVTYYRMNADTPRAGLGVELKCKFRVRGTWRRLWVLGHGLLKRIGVPV